MVQQQDIFIAKNYLNHDEIDTLNRLVVIFLETAELRVKNRTDILPAQNFAQVPENELAMLHLAKEVGISVPETNLVPLEKIAGLPELGFFSENLALAVKRFDRKEKQRIIHIEDFAQVYNVSPNDKYNKVSYDNIASCPENRQILLRYTGRAVFF